MACHSCDLKNTLLVQGRNLAGACSHSARLGHTQLHRVVARAINLHVLRFGPKRLSALSGGIQGKGHSYRPGKRDATFILGDAGELDQRRRNHLDDSGRGVAIGLLSHGGGQCEQENENDRSSNPCLHIFPQEDVQVRMAGRFSFLSWNPPSGQRSRPSAISSEKPRAKG